MATAAIPVALAVVIGVIIAVTNGGNKVQLDMGMETGFSTPVPAVGDNLATFMGARLAASFTDLNCQNFGLSNPVTVTTDGGGVATAVAYTLTQQQATVPRGNGTAASGRGKGAYDKSVPHGRHGHRENGAGM